MKEIMNFVRNVFIILYIVVIIFMTICLLSYNDYGVTEFENITILPVIDENLEPDYTLGDLLIIKKKISDISVGDTVLFYRTLYGETVVNYAKITNVEVITEKESTITVEGDYTFSSSNLIGKTSTTKIIPKVGYVVNILASRYGFLFLGVLPSLLLFLHTGYSLFLEATSSEDGTNGKKSRVETEEKISQAKETISDEQKKSLIEAKLKSMTDEQKKSLIEAKLKSMTDEEKKALLEAKRKKLEGNK